MKSRKGSLRRGLAAAAGVAGVESQRETEKTTKPVIISQRFIMPRRCPD